MSQQAKEDPYENETHQRRKYQAHDELASRVRSVTRHYEPSTNKNALLMPGPNPEPTAELMRRCWPELQIRYAHMVENRTDRYQKYLLPFSDAIDRRDFSPQVIGHNTDVVSVIRQSGATFSYADVDACGTVRHQYNGHRISDALREFAGRNMADQSILQVTFQKRGATFADTHEKTTRAAAEEMAGDDGALLFWRLYSHYEVPSTYYYRAAIVTWPWGDEVVTITPTEDQQGAPSEVGDTYLPAAPTAEDITAVTTGVHYPIGDIWNTEEQE